MPEEHSERKGMSGGKLSRRAVIGAAAALAGAGLWGRGARAQGQGTLPGAIKSQDGLLTVELDAGLRPVTVAGQLVQLFAYGGRVPGPRLELKAGDTLRLRFVNRLKEPTNLHFHGLHVSPSGNADNIFLEVPPGATQDYEFQIPADHPAGTFWYHPHLHGLVAKQVFLGLSGLLIVRGALDEIPEVAAANEAFAVLKDFAIQGGQVPPPAPMDTVQGREGPVVTVNGKARERFVVPRGGLLRLRLLNASSSRFYHLRLENHPLYLIATDGGALSEPVELDTLLLAPGERAEVLIRGDRNPGSYRLLDLGYDRGVAGMGAFGGTRQAGTRVLAEIVYGEARRPALPLPERLLPVVPLENPVRTRRFVLGHGMQMGRGMVFMINGRIFSPQRVDTSVRLGEVEEWEIVNAGVMDHPFHLHTNPFQIVSRNGYPETVRAWKDVVLVRRGERVRIRVAFKDFPGKTVYHCHILDHEDLGMMGIIEFRKGDV